MVPSIEIKAQKGVLVAGYQPAATLSMCLIRHIPNQLNKLQSSFSAHILRVDNFWVQRPSHIILCMGIAFWKWPIQNFEMSLEQIEGMVQGDPSVMIGLPSYLKEWHDES